MRWPFLLAALALVGLALACGGEEETGAPKATGRGTASPAAVATECAADQGKFWEYNHLLFEKWEGENVGTYRAENLKSYAQELGLDSQQFTACLDRGQHRASGGAAQ